MNQEIALDVAHVLQFAHSVRHVVQIANGDVQYFFEKVGGGGVVVNFGAQPLDLFTGDCVMAGHVFDEEAGRTEFQRVGG